MEIMASNYLLDHKDAYVKIAVVANNPANVLSNVTASAKVLADARRAAITSVEIGVHVGVVAVKTLS